MPNFNQQQSSGWSPTRIFLAVATGVLVLAALFSVGSLFENLDAESVMVIQGAMSGDLAFHVTPGLKVQNFGAEKHNAAVKGPFTILCL